MSPRPTFYWIKQHLRKKKVHIYYIPFMLFHNCQQFSKLSSDPKKKHYNYKGLKSNLGKCYLKSLRLLKAKHMEVYFPFLLTVVLSRPVVLSFHGISSIHCSKISAFTTVGGTKKAEPQLPPADPIWPLPPLTQLLSRQL